MTTKINSVNGEIIQNKCIYEWKVTDLNCCKTFGEYILSPKFSSRNGEFQWQLKLWPCGEKKEDEGYISLYLMSLNSSTVKPIVRLIIDSNDYNTITREFSHEIEIENGLGYAKFCKKKNNTDSAQLLNNNLSIYCEFFYTNDPSDFLTLIEKTKLKTLDNVGQFLEDEDFSDVTIKVSEKEFRKHKIILAAGSKVFAAMFKTEMIEKKTNVVEIENIDPEIFEQVLEFIYTGETKFEEETNKPLLIAADRYDIKGLKNLCAHKLLQSISIDNVVELLKFADTYNVEILKNNTIDFIVTNAKNIIDLPVYESLKTVSSDSLAELFRKLTLSH